MGHKVSVPFSSALAKEGGENWGWRDIVTFVNKQLVLEAQNLSSCFGNLVRTSFEKLAASGSSPKLETDK